MGRWMVRCIVCPSGAEGECHREKLRHVVAGHFVMTIGKHSRIGVPAVSGVALEELHHDSARWAVVDVDIVHFVGGDTLNPRELELILVRRDPEQISIGQEKEESKCSHGRISLAWVDD